MSTVIAQPTPAATDAYEERPYRRRSAIIAGIGGVILVLLILLPFLTYPVPPLGQEGILVNLGVIDFGEGDENGEAAAAPVAETAAPAPSTAEALPTPVEPLPTPEPEPLPEIATVPPPTRETREPETAPTATPDPELLRQQEAAAIRLRDKRAAEQAAEAEAKARAAAEASAAAEAKAAADAKRASELRNATGSLFNGNQGSGGGRGDTGRDGNQGDENGDPRSPITTGVSSGTGVVGGGLSNRGVVSSPRLTDKSQERGRVVVSVCVDASGRVTKANYTQKGSRNVTQRLIQLAEANARSYRFNPGQADLQCGVITYDFVVQ